MSRLTIMIARKGQRAQAEDGEVYSQVSRVTETARPSMEVRVAGNQAWACRASPRGPGCSLLWGSYPTHPRLHSKASPVSPHAKLDSLQSPCQPCELSLCPKTWGKAVAL